jgi:hypothetical protein
MQYLYARELQGCQLFLSVSIHPTFSAVVAGGRGDTHHSLRLKKGVNVDKKCFILADHNFPSTVFAKGKWTVWDFSERSMACSMN